MFKVGALGPGLEEALGVAKVLNQLIFLQRSVVLGDELLLVIDPDFMGVGFEGQHFIGVSLTQEFNTNALNIFTVIAPCSRWGGHHTFPGIACDPPQASAEGGSQGHSMD